MKSCSQLHSGGRKSTVRSRRRRQTESAAIAVVDSSESIDSQLSSPEPSMSLKNLGRRRLYYIDVAIWLWIELKFTMGCSV